MFSYTSDSDSSGFHNGGPTSSDGNTDDDRRGRYDDWDEPRSPYRNSASNSPPTTPRSRSPSTHGMKTRSRSQEKRMTKFRETGDLMKEFAETFAVQFAKSQAEILAQSQTQKIQLQFQYIRDENLTTGKLNTHLLNLDAHFVRVGMIHDIDKKNFLGTKLEGYTLACFNELLPKSLTYEALVKGLREKRFGPTDRWQEMLKITYNGTGNPVEYCRDKLEALKQYDPKYSTDMAVEQFLGGLATWSEEEDIRKESYRMRGDPKKLEKLKNFFLSVASMPQKKEEGVNVVQEEKKCFECKKLGHLVRDCPERRNGGSRRPQYNSNYNDRYNNRNNNNRNNNNVRGRDDRDRCYTCDGRGHKSNVCPSNRRKNDTWKNGQRNDNNGNRDERRTHSRERSVDRNGMNVERNERRHDDRDEGRKEVERGEGRSTKVEVPVTNKVETIEMLTKDLKPILKESKVIVFADPENVNVNILCTSSSEFNIEDVNKPLVKYIPSSCLTPIPSSSLEEKTTPIFEGDVATNTSNISKENLCTKHAIAEKESAIEDLEKTLDANDTSEIEDGKEPKTKKVTYANRNGTRIGISFRVNPIRKLPKYGPKRGPKYVPPLKSAGWIQPKSKSDEEIFTIDELKVRYEECDEDKEEEEIEMNTINTWANKRNASIGLLKVGAKIEDHPCEVLLDSGAKVNCVSQSFITSLKEAKITSCSKSLVGANKTSLKVLGSIKLKIGLEGNAQCVEETDEAGEEEDNTYHWRKMKRGTRQKVYKRTKDCHEIEFIVVKELSIPILIGFPTMEEMGTVLDTRKGTVSFGSLGNEIIMPYKGREEEYVYTLEETVIAPRTQDQYIKIRCDQHKGANDDILFAIEDMMLIPGLTIEEGLVSNKSAGIIISNYTDKSFRLEKGLPLGLLKKAKWKEEDKAEEIMTVDEESIDEEAVGKEVIDFQEDRKKALSGKGISAAGLKKIGKLLSKFKESFKRKIVYDESKMKLEPYKLRMKSDAIPVIEAMGRNNPERHQAMDASIQDLADRGMIEEGKGAYRSRVLLVKKPDGSWRTVIDYRKVNAQMIPDSYPMPRIDDMLDNLNGARFFSKLDMTDGFWQIGLEESSREVTGFASRSKFWRWKVLPMGVMNSPSAFQRAMDQVLGDLKWRCVMCYVDDLIIYSKTLQEHLEHIEAVLKKLEDAGIYTKLAKCQFGVEEIKFLGHIVGKDGMKPDPEKTKAVKMMDIPKDEKAVSRFLGMAGFYRKYIKDFSARTINLRGLTRKDVKFNFTKECLDELNDIKDALVSGPVMIYPDFKKKFILSTDASYRGLGATLSQMGPKGEQVISYASRTLNSHEKNYGVTKLEALGVVWATELFKVYLQDHPFDLITDHKALVKFKELKDTNPMLERWSIKLSQYDFDIFYREGKKHDNVDCLSRDPVNIVTDEDEIIKEFRRNQKEDHILGGLYDQVFKNGTVTFDKKGNIEERELKRGYDSIAIKADGRMYKRSNRGEETNDRLCIPKKCIAKILREAHCHHHFETKKTYNELKEKVWWDGMYGDCDVYCKSCDVCARRNSPTGKQKGLIKMMDVSRKFELVGIDLMKPGPKSDNGFVYVLVVTDYATKWSSAIPIKDKKAMTVANAMWEEWICKFGFPERIISDNGGEFTGDEMCKALIEVSKIKQQLTTPYNPRANGQVERFNKVLAARLAKYDNQSTWDEHVATTCYDYNISKHSSTGETPYFLVFGQEPKTGLDEILRQAKEQVFDAERWRKEGIPSMLERIKIAQKNRRKKQVQEMERKNKDKVTVVYSVGDKVWVREEPRTDSDKEIFKKLLLPWVGPFEISKADTKIYGNSYQVKRVVEGVEDTRVINIRNLKKYVERPEWMKLEDDWVPIEKDDMEVGKARPEKEQDDGGAFLPDKPAKKVGFEPLPPSVTTTRGKRDLWVKKAGDLVDIRFNKKVSNKPKQFWSCGKIEKIDPDNRNRLYCTFLDGLDEGWYDLEFDTDGMREIRRCEEKGGHTRSEHLSVLALEEDEERLCKRKRNSNARKKEKKKKLCTDSKTSKDNKGVNEAAKKSEEETTFSGVGVHEESKAGMLDSGPPQPVTRNTTESSLKLKLTVGGVPVELEGQLELVMLALKRLT